MTEQELRKQIVDRFETTYPPNMVGYYKECGDVTKFLDGAKFYLLGIFGDIFANMSRELKFNMMDYEFWKEKLFKEE